MKRKRQRVVDLIFSRPTSANIRWHDIEGLFIELGAEVEERAGSRVSVFCLERCVYFTVRTHRQIPIRVPSPAFASGWSNTELNHERNDS